MGNNMANPEDYQAVIAALGEFQSNISGCCSGLKSAGQECLDNLNHDVHTAKQVANLNDCASNIEKMLEGISEIQQNMQKQLSEIMDFNV